MDEKWKMGDFPLENGILMGKAQLTGAFWEDPAEIC